MPTIDPIDAKPRLRRAPRLLWTVPAAAASLAALGTAGAQEILLDTITVTATRTDEPTIDALSPTTVIDRDTLEEEVQPDRISDIMRLIPGVSTSENADDPGTGINIRGLQDFGRVNVMIDGARQNFQRSGHNANGTVYFDPEMLRAVDVTRGPSATIYGSGAIGGVVNFSTLGADDVLAPGEVAAGSAKGMFETNGPAWLGHAETAARWGEGFDIAAAGTWRDDGDYEDGEGETIGNSGQGLLSGLVKARFRPAEGHEATASALVYHDTFTTGIPIDGVDDATFRDTVALAETYTLGYTFARPDLWWADFNAKVYYTSTSFDQDFEEQLVRGGPFVDAEQNFTIATTGVDVFDTLRFDTGEIGHTFTFGADWFRDRVTTDDPTGSSDDITPSGERSVYGAYVQDQIAYGRWLEVIGALRFDSYSLSGGGLESEGDRVSPKITVGITPWEPITVYATYAEGYRAPSVTETLVEGLHPPPVTFPFIPNPDLKPEVAHNTEIGVNLRFQELVLEGDGLQVKANAYRNRVDDYIEGVLQNPSLGEFFFQYQNIGQANLWGYELEAAYDAGTVFAVVTGQVLEGENADTGEPLLSVPPNRLVTTLGFRAFDERLVAGLRTTFVAGSTEQEAIVDGVSTTVFPETKGYGLLDLFATYEISDSATVGFYVDNVFDRQYTQYLDLSPSPGFTAKLALTLRLGVDAP